MNILIVGASAGLGRALAEEGAALGHDLLLSATDGRDLAPLASDLRLRHGIKASCVPADICLSGDRLRLVQATRDWLSLDALLLPIGLSRDDDMGALDDTASARILNTNFLALASLVSALWPALSARDQAFIVGFGSIAAFRGRRRKTVYAAGKRALESYFESLRAMAEGGGVRVQMYRLGYMRTQQTFGRKLLLPIASPEDVAKVVYRRLGKSPGLRSHPWWWGPIGSVLQRLPWVLYRRLDF